MRGRGAVSLVVLLFAWAALDDITTDTAQRFVVEQTILVLSGIWFAGIGTSLLVRRRRLLGLSSLGAVGIGVLVFSSLPHRGEAGTAVNYLGLVPLVWFVGLTVWMLAVRRAGGGAATTGPATNAGDFNVPRTG